LVFFKTVSPFLGRLSGGLSGTVPADRTAAVLEKAARRVRADAGAGNENPAGPFSGMIAMIRLLVKRGFAQEGALLADALGQLIDDKNGALRVSLETAQTVDEGFLRDFEAALIKAYGAKSARIAVTVKPELLCGCRWTTGGIRTDCSLAGRLARLERMMGVTG
jgi:F0F1-type ATP synthase delta subunit